MYFWSCKRAANIHMYANVSFPLISSKIGSKKYPFCPESMKNVRSYFGF